MQATEQRGIQTHMRRARRSRGQDTLAVVDLTTVHNNRSMPDAVNLSGKGALIQHV